MAEIVILRCLRSRARKARDVAEVRLIWLPPYKQQWCEEISKLISREIFVLFFFFLFHSFCLYSDPNRHLCETKTRMEDNDRLRGTLGIKGAGSFPSYFFFF